MLRGVLSNSSKMSRGEVFTLALRSGRSPSKNPRTMRARALGKRPGDIRLGRLWSASVSIKEGHRTVETGPYRLVRHPIYTGFIVAYAAIAMLSATVVSLSAVTCLTIGFWLKARLEEQFLCEKLGAESYL